MGLNFTKFKWQNFNISSYVVGHQRKRKRSIEEESFEKALHTPKKKKLMCTSKYIYQALFVEGKDHDVVVEILGEQWKLHKIYLKQSPYFASMFCGAWNETNKSVIKIEVADDIITLDALRIVLGSMYLDEFSVEPRNVVGVLAGAVLFQLDGLIEQCVQIMRETISPLTAVSYYVVCCRYNLNDLKLDILEWFPVNLLRLYYENSPQIRYIDIELMTALLTNPKLCVIQTEFSLYLLLRRWLYLQLHHPPSVMCPSGVQPQDNASHDDTSLNVQEYFVNRPESSGPFLLSSEGSAYVPVFRCLRLPHLMIHVKDMDTLITDRIIPDSWLMPTLSETWKQVLKLDHNLDIGPTIVGLDESVFRSQCIRCARLLESYEQCKSWRWNIYTFGVHLVWSVLAHKVTVELYRKSEPQSPSLGTEDMRRAVLEVVIYSLDDHRRITQVHTTGIKEVAISDKTTEFKLLKSKDKFRMPIVISINLMLVTPSSRPSDGTSSAVPQDDFGC